MPTERNRGRSLITRPFDKIEVHHPTDPETFHAYDRDTNLARPWAIPGTVGLEHRIGGLEKEDISGHVSYSPENHQKMTDLRLEKIDKVRDYLPPLEPHGSSGGDLLVLGWGARTVLLSRRWTVLERQGTACRQLT